MDIVKERKLESEVRKARISKYALEEKKLNRVKQVNKRNTALDELQQKKDEDIYNK